MLDERGVKSGVCKWTGMFLSSCDRDARAGQMYVLRISSNKKKRKPNRATLTPTKVRNRCWPPNVHHPYDVFPSPILRGITYKIEKSLKFFAL